METFEEYWWSSDDSSVAATCFASVGESLRDSGEEFEMFLATELETTRLVLRVIVKAETLGTEGRSATEQLKHWVEASSTTHEHRGGVPVRYEITNAQGTAIGPVSAGFGPRHHRWWHRW